MKQLETGDVLCCQGKSLISKAIKFFTGSKITHTGIVLNLDGKIFIAESQKEGFNLIQYDNWKKKFNYDYIAFRPNEEYDKLVIEGNIFKKLGTVPYDFNLFIFRYPKKIIKEIFIKKDIDIKSVDNEDKREICSESVANILGWDEPQNYVPIDVYNRCIKEKFLIL
jgi:hypothetical protein